MKMPKFRCVTCGEVSIHGTIVFAIVSILLGICIGKLT